MHSWSWPPGFVIAPVIRGSMALLSRVQARSFHLLLMSCSMHHPTTREKESPGTVDEAGERLPRPGQVPRVQNQILSGRELKIKAQRFPLVSPKNRKNCASRLTISGLNAVKLRNFRPKNR